MGSGGGKYKSRKYINALQKLASRNQDKFVLEPATKELWKVKWSDGEPRRSYPIAANHRGISEAIAKELGKLLEQHGVCTKEEFLEMIK